MSADTPVYHDFDKRQLPKPRPKPPTEKQAARGKVLATGVTCFCGMAGGSIDVARHKDEQGHWRCRSAECGATFASCPARNTHERKACKLVLRCPVPVCRGKTLKLDALDDRVVGDDWMRYHSHITAHAFCYTCAAVFANCRDLEEHAVQLRHRLHPAQVALYPTVQAPTQEAATMTEFSRGHGNPGDDDPVSAALGKWFLYEHDCKLGPLLVAPDTGADADSDEARFNARLDEAKEALFMRGRVTHLPYMYALANIIATSHNG